jgi:3-methylfumaryl-CoA hydratase
MKKDQTLFSFDYKCIAPLYVNQPMTLHGKMTENGCDLWILNDKDNLAVKGSAKFSLYLHEDKNKQTL